MARPSRRVFYDRIRRRLHTYIGPVLTYVQMALPISCEVRRRALVHREASDTVRLVAIRHAAMVLTPRAFLRIAEQVRAGDMMIVAGLGAA